MKIISSSRSRACFPGYITAEQASRLGLRIRRLRPMTPLEVLLFLGYRVQRWNQKPGSSPVPCKLLEVEQAVAAWLPALGLELHEEWGKTHEKAPTATERYVDFRVPAERPALFTPRPGSECKVWVDPTLATWSKADFDRQRIAATKRNQRLSAAAARQRQMGGGAA